MSWVRIDDQLAFHPKAVSAGNEAIGAWLRLICWSAAHLTDGRIPNGIQAVICGNDGIIRILCEKNLLEKDGDDYKIHDYLEWNPSSKDVKTKRKGDAARKRGIQTESKRNPTVPSPSPSRIKDPPIVPQEKTETPELFAATMAARFHPFGVLVPDAWSISECCRLIAEYSQLAGTNPDTTADDAVRTFAEIANGWKVPVLTPQMLVKHWATVQSRMGGCQPSNGMSNLDRLHAEKLKRDDELRKLGKL